jgi:hypothetical protein
MTHLLHRYDQALQTMLPRGSHQRVLSPRPHGRRNKAIHSSDLISLATHHPQSPFALQALLLIHLAQPGRHVLTSSSLFFLYILLPPRPRSNQHRTIDSLLSVPHHHSPHSRRMLLGGFRMLLVVSTFPTPVRRHHLRHKPSHLSLRQVYLHHRYLPSLHPPHLKCRLRRH